MLAPLSAFALAVAVLVHHPSAVVALSVQHAHGRQLVRRLYPTTPPSSSSSSSPYGSADGYTSQGSWYDNGTTGGSSYSAVRGSQPAASGSYAAGGSYPTGGSYSTGASSASSGSNDHGSHGSWYDNGTTGGSSYSAVRGSQPTASGSYAAGGSYATTPSSNDGWDPIPTSVDTSKMYTIHYGPDGKPLGQQAGSQAPRTEYNVALNGKVYDQVHYNGAGLLSQDGWDPIPTSVDPSKMYTVHYSPDGKVIGTSNGTGSSASGYSGQATAVNHYSTPRKTKHKVSQDGGRASYGRTGTDVRAVYENAKPSSSSASRKKTAKKQHRKVKKVTKVTTTYYE